jgi:hypothetical protein
MAGRAIRVARSCAWLLRCGGSCVKACHGAVCTPRSSKSAAVELTLDDVGDVSALPGLLVLIENPIGSVTADGAYDGDTVYDEVLQ